MARKNAADDEDRQNEDRGLIHETMILDQWPRLPPLQGRTKHYILHRVRGPEGQDPLQGLKHRYAIVRHLTCVAKGARQCQDFGISFTGNGSIFWWRTGIPLNASDGYLKLVWKVPPCGNLSDGTWVVEPQAGNVTRVHGRRFPSESQFALSGHGLYRNNERGHITAMGSSAYGSNLLNVVEGLKSRRDLTPYTYFLDKYGSVSGQWLVATPEGTVAVLKEGTNGTVYLATSLEAEMAAAQVWVCNPPKPHNRSNNDRRFSQGGIA